MSLTFCILVAQSVAYRTREQEVTGSFSGSANFLSAGIGDSYCGGSHFSLTADLYLVDGDTGKQLVAWKEYCVDYW